MKNSLKILRKTSRRHIFLGAALFWASLTFACAGPRSPVVPGSGQTGVTQGVQGTLTHLGEPLAGGRVYVYRNDTTNMLGPADFASDPSAADGSFAIELVEGDYYLVARKRAGGGDSGPLVMGDLYSSHSSKAVPVTKGNVSVVDLELEEMRDPMLFQSISRRGSATGIRGRIVDTRGRPVPWVFAMAYAGSDMKRIPDYTSALTGDDGKFVIFLPGGGTYWLAARKNMREKPAPGEPYGLYQGTPDHSLTVPDGHFVEGITITLTPFK